MPSVRLLFGPILIGVFLNMILYGVLLVQIYHYHLTYKKDAPWIKYLVYYLFAVETINTACDIAIVFQPLIDNFGKPEATMYFPTMFAAEPIVIVAISTPIQLFFAWRIKLLTKSNILALIVCALSITSLAGGAWTTGLLVKIKLFSRKPELHWPALVWFLSACVADVMITVVLVFTLSKRKTGFVATDGAIEKIIRLTVQTGMLTAFFAIGDVIFFMSLPHTALNFVWDLALSKLYSNCLLSTLNSRLSIQSESGFHPTYHKQGVSSSGGARRPGVSAAVFSQSKFLSHCDRS
ncbi:hypothetical protein HYPSUDRAFT_393214 [Hypholoma sublateritium FD-334 SS-4]|uniref:DUF6534 domain-containing protein n=1 Tax=Hypholoma sublateritium (strain FD-334 SS-4) TaxID=945553 RepID=A0A0D2KL14_HYPSF|nr:hypothetical protein HYPSUDRAFT_393214 [Hypholoma sublateritium FD-334 SS-4]